MRTRDRRTVSIFLIVVVATIALGSCAPFGTSKKDRVLRFEADLNGSREYAYQNFLEAETTDYTTIRDNDPGTTWDVWFPPDFPDPGTYTISLDSLFGNPLDGTVNGPDAFGGPKSIQFHFARSGVYWYLEGLTLEGWPSKIVD
jgi:hypothetical protein